MTDNLEIGTSIFYGNNEENSDTETSVTDEEVEETSTEEPGEEEILDTDESSEVESTEDENSDEEQELLVFDIEGEEVSLDQIKEWKSNGLMQADYTRKTQELSDNRKLLEDDTTNLKDALESVKTLTAELEASIGVEDNVNMDELREDDEGEYYKLLHLKEKKEKLIAKAKKEFDVTQGVSNEVLAAEQKKLMEVNPEWVKDKKTTKAYDADMDTLDNYLKVNGWTQEEFKTVYQEKHMTALIKAAKYDALQVKTKNISKKVKAVAKVTKSKAKGNQKPVEKEAKDIFYNS